MGVSERRSKTRRRTLRAVSAKESAHVDHASQEAVCPLIVPPTRFSLLDPSVTKPLYCKITRRASHKPLRESFSEPRRAERRGFTYLRGCANWEQRARLRGGHEMLDHLRNCPSFPM